MPKTTPLINLREEYAIAKDNVRKYKVIRDMYFKELEESPRLNRNELLQALLKCTHLEYDEFMFINEIAKEYT